MLAENSQKLEPCALWPLYHTWGTHENHDDQITAANVSFLSMLQGETGNKYKPIFPTVRHSYSKRYAYLSIEMKMPPGSACGFNQSQALFYVCIFNN